MPGCRHEKMNETFQLVRGRFRRRFENVGLRNSRSARRLERLRKPTPLGRE